MEKDICETAFHDHDGYKYEFNRAGVGLTVLPAAFIISKRAPNIANRYAISWLDKTFMSAYPWKGHSETSKSMPTKMLATNLSEKFGMCIYAGSHQESLGMFVHCTRVRSSVSKIEGINRIPRPTEAKELRIFLGITATKDMTVCSLRRLLSRQATVTRGGT